MLVSLDSHTAFFFFFEILTSVLLTETLEHITDSAGP